MRLSEILSEELISISLQQTEKISIIHELVDILDRAKKLKDRDAVLEAVLKREDIMSTGMGDGVAIPHAKTKGVDDLVAAFGISRKGVDFQSIDQQPVKLVFLMVSPPEQTGPHLKALSRISRLMHRKSFRDLLTQAKSSAQIIDAITQEEQQYLSQ
ncbi:PTS sugar transporter subunit IIA [candidate division KSB1 bacterium]|nr:PTS sugar transporter subunit IIA [candidate division KSB1 bacterium]